MSIPHHIAWSRFKRVKDAFKCIRNAKDQGTLEIAQSRHVGPTFGVEPSLVKRIKARFRNELSFSGDGK